MTYFFTGDEHAGHRNIIDYCDRPFSSVEEMDEAIIQQHNAVVRDGDKVIHVGDFTLGTDAAKYIRRLRGKHTFLKGSHDRWLGEHAPSILEVKIDGQLIVACHYAMRVWPKSHYNSWQVYGHSHGRLPPIGKQHDVGVDNNDFMPVSYDQLRAIMATRDDNPNLVRR
jgi:calcineurin-like phosphoesterase family protein